MIERFLWGAVLAAYLYIGFRYIMWDIMNDAKAFPSPVPPGWSRGTWMMVCSSMLLFMSLTWPLTIAVGSFLLRREGRR